MPNINVSVITWEYLYPPCYTYNLTSNEIVT